MNNVIKWISNEILDEEIRRLMNKFSISEIESKILASRKISDEEIHSMLFDNSYNFHNPMLMKDAEKASDRIIKAIENNEVVVNYSDYDTDGFGSAVVFRLAMKKLGFSIKTYTNTRSMGFGICVDGIKQIIEKFGKPNLIVTTDNGIAASKEVTDFIKENGIDLIITDHHLPNETLPEALAVVDIKQKGETYPFKDLCGCGVIWKLMGLVFYKMKQNPEELNDLLDIVATSTVGDVVSLRGENRLIVKEGLKLINKEKRFIWTLFKKVFSTNFNQIMEVDSRTLGFNYVPAINACSRLFGTVNIPIKAFLLEEDQKEEVEFLVRKMFNTNERRKDLTKTQTEEAMNSFLSHDHGEKAIVIASENFHHGIVGIVAGRMKEEFNKPAFVLGYEPELDAYRGSIRSISSFPIKEVLDELNNDYPDLMTNYGGHALAGGLTVKREKFSLFKDLIQKKAETLISEEDLQKEIKVDAVIDENSVNLLTLKEIKSLEPFGQGFPVPIVKIDSFVPKKLHFMGAKKQHLKLISNVSAIYWNKAKEFEEKFLNCETFSMVGELEYSNFDKTIIIKVNDIKKGAKNESCCHQ